MYAKRFLEGYLLEHVTGFREIEENPFHNVPKAFQGSGIADPTGPGLRHSGLILASSN
jgi:hypothetical protein